MSNPTPNMGAFWDKRAREDALFFVDDRVEYGKADLDAFFAGGAEAVGLFEEHLAFRVAGDHLVEIGCGVGRLTRVLATRATEIRAFDVSARMLELAERHNPGLANVEWMLGDGVSLAGVQDGWADGVFSHVVFQHIPDPAITLGYVREMGRVLSPGGWAAFQISNDPTIHTAHRSSVSERIRASLRRGPRGRSHPAWVGSAVSLPDLRATATAAGMEVEQTAGEGTQYCIVRLRKR